jgi:hypothetical protein
MLVASRDIVPLSVVLGALGSLCLLSILTIHSVSYPALVDCNGFSGEWVKAESCMSHERVGVMQVRLSTVRNWFNRGITQKVSLFLHRKPPGHETSEAFQVARWGEITNVLEKLYVAQAINLALEKVRPFTEAEEEKKKAK